MNIVSRHSKKTCNSISVHQSIMNTLVTLIIFTVALGWKFYSQINCTIATPHDTPHLLPRCLLASTDANSPQMTPYFCLTGMINSHSGSPLLLQFHRTRERHQTITHHSNALTLPQPNWVPANRQTREPPLLSLHAPMSSSHHFWHSPRGAGKR